MSNQASDDNNLLNFIAATVETMRDQMATKSDLAFLRDQMATKTDLARLDDRLLVETTAIRGDLEQVQLRLDSIDHALSTRLSQIETEVSRLRSVV